MGFAILWKMELQFYGKMLCNFREKCLAKNRQACALSPEKKGKKTFDVKVNEALCLGDACGCNRLCTRVFRCPALTWDRNKKKAAVDDVICAGCGVCASICPEQAIMKMQATVL
jgi:indolepyruvate ferredoxin oxidoreductase alpha subunit